MKVSIPELIIGDVIKTNRFVAKVVDQKDFKDCSQVQVSFVSGDKTAFDYLSKQRLDGLATLQGNKLATVELLHAEFESMSDYWKAQA